MKNKDILSNIHKSMAEREQSYRAKALKMFPHVCASCSREFSGIKLKELTVHHKDHNHENNPEDGSNWELLCIYCHDHEHEKHKMKGYGSSKNQSIKLSGFTALEVLNHLFPDHEIRED